MQSASAQDTGTRIAGPYFHESSKRYFELHRLPGFKHRYSWAYVRKLAARMAYKKARGELAVVENADVHNFLVRNFKFPGPTWIGLRYFCGPKKLLWVNGEVHEPGEFAVWHPQWAGNPSLTCQTNRMQYMPAYYRGKGSFRWQVQAESKAYPWFLVQYRLPD